VEPLSRPTLSNLLQLYEGAIRELEALNDPSVARLLHRMQQHRTEVIKALSEPGSTT
jgi:hypothetical protein